MRRACGLLLASVLGLWGCTPGPSRPAAVATTRAVLRIEGPGGERAVQSISHRWQRGDVYRYDVALRRWDGAAYVDLTPPVVVALPQKGTPSSLAVFTNLRQGERYLAAVTAWGNVGGTAATRILNAREPSRVVLDFSRGQDVERELSLHLSVTLDPVPFSGTLTVVPEHLPKATTTLELRLHDLETNRDLYTARYAKTRTMVIAHARTGVRYRILLTARSRMGAVVGRGRSAEIFFDPAGQDLEQDLSVPVAF